MDISRLTDDYRLDQKLIESLRENNNDLQKGLHLIVSKGSILDYLKFNFYFHDQNENLTRELLKYSYFISNQAQFDITITNEKNKEVLSAKNLTKDTLFLGKNREDILQKLGWISCTQNPHHLYIRKVEEEFLIDKIALVSEEYLSALILDILDSHKFRTDALGIKVSEFSRDFLENLKYLEVKFTQHSKQYVFIKELQEVIRHVQMYKDITPALNLINKSASDFWTWK